jgi:hypothetical protein
VRAVAVDWSGAAAPAAQRRAIWVAEAVDGVLVALGAGRTRDETIDHLLDRLGAEPETVVGLDFSFSFSAWWGRAVGAPDGPAVWAVTAELGERWLAECRPPFWGRPGRPRPAYRPDQPEWRRTELLENPGQRRPKSTFQVGGTGTVGTGSIRGMPSLTRMRAAGAKVWPFDPWPRSGPVVAEVYPRWCTGPVVKSDPGARDAHLQRGWPGLAPALRRLAVASEDAFDAACTALTLSTSPCRLPATDAVDAAEGRMLVPRTLVHSALF